jgi:putative tryptophan/tyrosine transport system substrate-binding protein
MPIASMLWFWHGMAEGRAVQKANSVKLLRSLKRRDLIAMVGGAAVTWPFAAATQQAGKLPTIGFLGATTAAAWARWVPPFLQRLHELGWVEGKTIAIEYRWAEGRTERYAKFAAEFVRLKVDVIVTAGSAAIAVKQATSSIPIVLAVMGDPIEDGLVKSLARPGGNITGTSLQQDDSAGKRLGLLREVIPHLRRLGILYDAGYPADAREVGVVEATVRPLGIQISRLALRHAADIGPAFEALKGGADALYVCTEALTVTNRQLISTLARTARLPLISGAREDVETGDLMSYGPSFPDLFRRAAELVDKILRGSKPADIPIEQPTKFELVVNLKTAKELGVTIPTTILAQADSLIE